MSTRSTLYATIAEAAARQPGVVAVIDASTLLDYRTLLRAIDARAASLLRHCRPGDRAGVLLECSADTVVTYFACLRAGVLYTPLGTCPERVLHQLIVALGLKVLVSDRPLEPGVPCLRPGDDAVEVAELPVIEPAAPAHLLPTSGTSTGMPRACLTDQTGSVLSHAWRTALCPFRSDDAVGCNVFGIWDVVPALQQGVPVVMIPDAALRDPVALAGTVVRHRITRMMLTPSLLGACLASPVAVDALRQLRLLVLCGEIAKPAVLDRALAQLPRTRLLNLYSISECHDVAAGFVTGGETRLWPATFADVRVVDPEDRDRPAAIGEVGRIVVGGPGVALGYAGAISGRFYERDGMRFYDTGDLGRLHATGELTIVGRADSRVKIRGRWVDPAEVEAVLAAHPDVVDATARIVDARLTAVVLGRGADLVRRLRAHAAEHLPEHAVPDRIELVDRPRLSPAGKAAGDGAAIAGDHLERRVVELFRRALNDQAIGPDDDFFDAGGNSLDAIELCGRLQALTHRPIRVAELYRAGRPRAVARLLVETGPPAPEPWRLPATAPAVTGRWRGQPWGNPLVTGATGYLGGAVVRALHRRCVTLERPGMDLDQPMLGLAPREFRALGRRTDGIIHVAARVDPFAGFETLYRTNVEGTLELIRLAGVHGVPIQFVSSSAALPLGSRGVWTPGAHPSEALADELVASGADAYAFTKLAAELALWRAAEAGLPVRIVRVPHVVGHPRRDRLLQTLAALVAAGVYPEGPWQWQFVSAEAVCEALVEDPRPGVEIRHVAFAPVALPELLQRFGLELRPVPPAAVATALGQVHASHPFHGHARTLLQLVNEHGPLPALSLVDALLSSSGEYGLASFERAFARFEGGGHWRHGEAPLG